MAGSHLGGSRLCTPHPPAPPAPKTTGTHVRPVTLGLSLGHTEGPGQVGIGCGTGVRGQVPGGNEAREQAWEFRGADRGLSEP